MRKPNFENLLKVLRLERPERPTLFEFFLNGPLYQRLAGPQEEWKPFSASHLRAFMNAGYDYATVNCGLGFEAGKRASEKSCSLNEGFVITDWASFEKYPWQDVDSLDYSQFDKIAKDIPEGMMLIVHGPGGVLENVIRLMGYDNLCLMLTDDPRLVEAVCEAVGSRLVRHYEITAAFDTVGAAISNDDWGFKTQPMLSPDDMRKYIVPWHRKIVQAIHKHKKPAILHSCGNLETLMDDIIDDIGYNGKHSYEDIIIPVEDAYEKWGGRIAIMGGIDLDFLCRETPERIKERCRKMLKRAERRGGFALGSGNSIPEYVPQENYMAMISVIHEA